MKAVLGIDPGVHGAIAVLAPDGAPVFLWPFNPEMSVKEAVKHLESAYRTLQHVYGASECWLEKVNSHPKDGHIGAFTFGKIAGGIEWALHAMGASVKTVAPAIWQARLGCLSQGNKNVTKKKAIELFSIFSPTLKITHSTADALLIAYYGQLQEEARAPSGAGLLDQL